jgi:hypothetical protein
MGPRLDRSVQPQLVCLFGHPAQFPPMAKWFYLTAGQTAGPIDAAVLKQLAVAGDLKPTDKVAKDGNGSNKGASAGVDSQLCTPECRRQLLLRADWRA